MGSEVLREQHMAMGEEACAVAPVVARSVGVEWRHSVLREGGSVHREVVRLHVVFVNGGEAPWYLGECGTTLL